MSFALPEQKEPFPLMICIQDGSAESSGESPPWPHEWNPTESASWQSVPVGRWVGLPLGCPGENLVHTVNQTEERTISEAMQERCSRIAQHGDDEAFLDTLSQIAL